MEKLLWKTTHKTDFSDENDFLEKMLKDYGVEDIETFLYPSEENELSPFLLKNIKQAVEMLHSFLETNKILYIKGDCDVDGATSLSVLVQFIKSIKPETNIIYEIDYNKRHGLFYADIVGKENIGLIIVPDASLSNKESIKIRSNKEFENIPILVLDHHEINEEEIDYITTVTVNCMDGEYPNNTLSGVGVVYKFCEAYCDTYGLNRKLIKQYIDLVAMGEVSDSMDLRNSETRYLVFEGLKEENYHNQFLNELQELFSEDMKFGRTITSIGWVLAPKINGAIRYGKHEEQDNLFRAICGEQEEIVYQPRRKCKTDPKPPEEIISLQKDCARVARNVKARQDEEVRKFVNKLEEEIKKNNLLENSILFINGTNLVEKNTVTGLVANKIASKYHRPVVLLKEFDDDTFGGSGRGYDKGNVEDFKGFLNDLQMFDMLAGHKGAFGIKINKKNVPKAVELCNKKLPKESLCTIYPVDWEIEANNLKKTYVEEVAENYKIWGNTVPEPLFVIKNLQINASKIVGYGENKNFIRFVYKNIAFIKKYCAHDDFEKITCWNRQIMGENKKNLTLNLICQFVLNSWEDKIIPQIKILYFDSQENLEKNRNDFDEDFDEIFSEEKKPIKKTKNKKIENEKEEKDIKEEEFDDFVF